MDPSPPTIPSSPTPDPTPPAASSWPFWVAAGLVLLPGLMGLTGNSNLASIGALLVAPVGSVAAGIVLGIRLGSTPGRRALLSCSLIVACLIASETIAALGCSASNPSFNVH